MDSSKDYYATLGVLPTAKDFIIQAAYRALSKVYHPDVYKGDYAGNKIAEINEAFEVLGNKSKRADYDKQREQSESDDSEFFNDNFNEWTDRKNAFNDEWKVALEHYPELDNIANELALISSRLSFSFKIYILQHKNYAEAEKVSEQIMMNFLTHFFGKNKLIHWNAKKLIKAKRIDALKDYIRHVSKHGSEWTKGTQKLSVKYGVELSVDDWVLREAYTEMIRSHSIEDVKVDILHDPYIHLWVTGEMSDKEAADSYLKAYKSDINFQNILFILCVIGILYSCVTGEW